MFGRRLSAILCFLPLILPVGCTKVLFDEEHQSRIQQVATTEGLVAFWDFAHSEGDGWISYHNSNTIDRTFPLWLRQIGDDAIYSASTWPYQDEDSLIMWDDTGPFGRAIRFNKGYIYGAVKREDFEETPLNIHGNQPFTMIAWVKFTGKRHLVAGIWDEGGWDKYSGRRQVALFGGLFGQKGVIAHISATGASSYPQSDAPGSQYARVRAIDGQPFKDDAWVSMAMTFDPETNACTAYLNGEMTPLKISDPVAQDVYQFEKPVYANPYNFSFPIYSPRAFVLKYNGYLHKGPVQEHRLHVDLDSGLLYYSRDEKVPGDKRSFRVRFDVRREDSSLLSEAVIMYAITGAVGHLPSGLKIEDGDIVYSALEVSDNGIWKPVGSSIARRIDPGAPFTLGRALGLGSEDLEHGSVLYMDGVAVFNRVLSREELKALSFRGK